MKIRIIAPAILAAVTMPVMAQTNVTIYGIVDAGLVRESGGANNDTKISSGVASVSRIGFRGNEDLGGGMAALFVLETGYKTDTGEVDTAGTIFNRQAFVGLKSSAGTVTLGRQYTPYYSTVSGYADLFAAGLAGSAKNMLPTSGSNMRTSNTVKYLSPKLPASGANWPTARASRPTALPLAARSAARLTYEVGQTGRASGLQQPQQRITATTGGRRQPRHRHQYPAGRQLRFRHVQGIRRLWHQQGLQQRSAGQQQQPVRRRPPHRIDRQPRHAARRGRAVGRGTILASVIDKNDKTAFDQDATATGGRLYLCPVEADDFIHVRTARSRITRGAGYTVGNGTEAARVTGV